MNFTIMTGDNRETLKTLADNSVDAIITDPPYGIDFLGKAWDANTGAIETYTECLRVLKPGGHILAFSAARTYHHLAITLEQAGFEIRDQIMWIYSSGFPKAQDIGKAIDKRAGNKDANYVGVSKTNKQKNKETKDGINDFGGGVFCSKCNRTINQSIINACPEQPCGQVYTHQTEDGKTWAGWKTQLKPAHEPICMARKPFKGSTLDNVLTHGLGALNIDATRIPYEDLQYTQGRFPSNVLGEIDGYQKFFYCPKVSRKERHVGFETKDIPTNPNGMLDDSYNDATRGQNYNDIALTKSGNNHPTVKPIELMKYLINLVTPPNSVVLDPFNGSGSTGMAAVELGHTYIGCELDPAYVDIATKRITAWNTPDSTSTFEDLFE